MAYLVNDVKLVTMSEYQFDDTTESSMQQDGSLSDLNLQAGSIATPRGLWMSYSQQIVFSRNVEIRPISSDQELAESIENNGGSASTVVRK